MSKHTPGPWTVGGARTLKVWGGPSPRDVICEPWHVAVGSRKANAHLIAAAPEMLEALKELDAHWSAVGPYAIGHDGERASKIKALIAKAEGRS